MSDILKLLVVATVLAGVGCGRAHLFYDARELRHQPLKKAQASGLEQAILKRAQGKRLTWRDARGQSRTLTVDRAGLAKLGLPELGALWLATASGERGGENDLRVHVDRRRVPVSVLIALDGNIELISGSGSSAARERSTASELRRRFSLTGELRGRWQPSELQALGEALAMLSARELDAVRATNFIRQRGRAERGALYASLGCASTITIYSSGVHADEYRFVGHPREPRHAMLHAVVHEIGHAVEHAPARQRYCAAERLPVARANVLIGEGNALTKDNEIMRGYRAALKGAPAPTDYGRTTAREGFAESFALFHVDPEALRRTSPSVYGWFARGAHVGGRR